MSNLDTINVGGIDFDIEDAVSRPIVPMVAYKEDGNTASQAYSIVGTPINWKGALYYTSATIVAGDIFEVGTNLTAAVNIGQMLSNIKTYVGNDNKLHFVDATGADSVLPFNGGATLLGTITGATTETFVVPEGTTTDNILCVVDSYNLTSYGRGSNNYSTTANKTDSMITTSISGTTLTVTTKAISCSASYYSDSSGSLRAQTSGSCTPATTNVYLA